MTYERLDKQCKAKVLSVNDNGVLLTASWPAQKSDEKRFRVQHGIATNTVQVSKEYFAKKYGVEL